jgi:hypothetical protein
LKINFSVTGRGGSFFSNKMVDHLVLATLFEPLRRKIFQVVGGEKFMLSEIPE